MKILALGNAEDVANVDVRAMLRIKMKIML